MKFKSFFLLGLASVAALFSSCVKEADINAPKFAAQIKASEDGIRQDTVDVEGGEVVIELLASQAWSATVDPGTSLDKVDDITIEPASGSASSSIVEVVVKVPANKDNDRSVKVSFIGSTYSAAVSFIQKGELGERLLECSVSDFIKKPVDASIYYLLTGEVGAISNEKYGNFNIIDPKTREEIYIYGLGVKEDLKKQNVFQEYGIQEGDLITIASTRGAYGTTQEGMNSYYISHKKSEKPSIKLGSSEVVAVVGTTFELPVVSNLVSWTLSSDVEWLSFEPASGSESTTVVVSVSDAGEGDTATITLSAEGLESVTCAVTRTNVQDATAAEINAAEDGKVFRVTGIVSKIANTTYGNLYIKDYTGEVYVYGTNNFAEENIAEGDVITVVGSKTSYKESPQMKNVDVEKHYSIKDTKVADFRAAEDNKEVYYRLTGKVTKSTEEYTKFDLEQYGNFALEDESGNVYVYGVLPGWGSAKGQFGSLEVKEGDTITIIAYKTTFKGLTQAGGGVYISHEAGQTPEPSLSVDGKQWVFEWQYNEEIKTTAVLDFGVYAEGQFTFAYDWSVLDPESYAGISPVYQGTYVVDEENSKVSLSLASIFDETEVLSGDITYSELTETTAHFELAEVFGPLGIQSADATVDTPEITDDPFIGGGEDEYYTLAEVADLGVGTGYQVKDVVVLASCNKRTIIADNTAFMFLFNDTTVEVGDVLTVSGDIVEYNGVLEWTNATVEVTSQGAAVTYPEAKAYGAEDFAQYVTYPVVEYVKFTAVHDGSKLWVGDTQIYLQNPTGLTPQAGEVEITGFTLGYSSDHSDVTVLVTSLEQKNYTSSIKVVANASVNVGETIELGASTNSPASLSYVSADESIATVSAEGVVSGVKEGTTTITVSVPAEGLYSEASAEVTITVNASGTVEPKVLYTLDTTGSLQGENNSYTGNCDVDVDGITWNVTGNTKINPWRIGGKSLDAVDREVYTKTAFPNALTSVDVTFGTASSITVNSCKLVYSTNADFSEASEISVEFAASSTVSFVADFPANAYYKLVLNVTVTSDKNKFVQLSKIEFIGK